MTAPEPEVDYFLDNYGECKRASCTCLRATWQGRRCPDWQPWGVTSAAQLMARLRRLDALLARGQTDQVDSR